MRAGVQPQLKTEDHRHCRLGRATVRVQRVADHSAVVRAQASDPLKLLTPRRAGGAAWIYTSTYGGGLVAGDRVDLHLDVGDEATAVLATQASTKVYRSVGEAGATQELTATLGRDGVLAVLPDPVSPFAHSRYAQTQRFHLHPTSGLLLLDWYTCGRLAMGERWAMQRYVSRNQVMIEGRVAFVDATVLQADDGIVAGRMRVGESHCFATLLFAGPAFAEGADVVHDSVNSEALRRGAPLLAVASRCRAGVVVRVAGERTEAVAACLRELTRFVSDVLGDDPWGRKW